MSPFSEENTITPKQSFAISRAEFTFLMDLIKNLQQLQARTSVKPSSAALASTPVTTDISHSFQPVLKKLNIPEILIFGLESDSMSHVINYNIHMDPKITSNGLKCQAFLATFDEQGKMWFASLTPSSIAGFK
ncbi:hypothetical protein ACLOJK_005351 [Asimina triloba]